MTTSSSISVKPAWRRGDLVGVHLMVSQPSRNTTAHASVEGQCGPDRWYFRAIRERNEST
jgi:hypothetical protein